MTAKKNNNRPERNKAPMRDERKQNNEAYTTQCLLIMQGKRKRAQTTAYFLLEGKIEFKTKKTKK